ncbi:TMV resistance protein N-like [Senna tora]|uniref:TMV resistance protein N-like n=1 Tax=Senna tora TaxID=362788 RepID=A0A835CHY8_9FABA|nr:TMV resistance protein N-like [Senna tora]
MVKLKLQHLHHMDAITALMLIEALFIIIALPLYQAIRFFSPNSSHAFNHVPLPSKIQQLWDETQKFPNLKKILLNSCDYLVRLPDLSQTPNIEEIYLNGCVNLVQVHSSSILTKLRHLMINNCNKLRLANLGGNIHGRISSRLVVVVYNYFDLKSLSFIRISVKVFMSDDDGGISSFGLKVETVPFREHNGSRELRLLGQSLSSLLPFVSQVRWLDVTSSIDSDFEMNLSHFPYYGGQKNQVPKVTELELQRTKPNDAKQKPSSMHPWMKGTVAKEVVGIGLESSKEGDDCCVMNNQLLRVPKSITCWSFLTELSLQKSEIESSVGGNYILGLSALRSFGECDCSVSIEGNGNASDVVLSHSQQLYHIDSRIFMCNIKVHVSKLSFEFLEWPYSEDEDAYRWLVRRSLLFYL